MKADAASHRLGSMSTCPTCTVTTGVLVDLPTTMHTEPHRRVDHWRRLPCGHEVSVVRGISLTTGREDDRPTLGEGGV